MWPIAETLTEKFVNGEYDKIELIYNQFKNAATQIANRTVLPLALLNQTFLFQQEIIS
jgi:F-type H+-transporting ATPase subunit gamma